MARNGRYILHSGSGVHYDDSPDADVLPASTYTSFLRDHKFASAQGDASFGMKHGKFRTLALVFPPGYSDAAPGKTHAPALALPIDHLGSGYTDHGSGAYTYKYVYPNMRVRWDDARIVQVPLSKYGYFTYWNDKDTLRRVLRTEPFPKWNGVGSPPDAEDPLRASCHTVWLAAHATGTLVDLQNPPFSLLMDALRSGRL